MDVYFDIYSCNYSYILYLYYRIFACLSYRVYYRSDISLIDLQWYIYWIREHYSFTIPYYISPSATHMSLPKGHPMVTWSKNNAFKPKYISSPSRFQFYFHPNYLCSDPQIVQLAPCYEWRVSCPVKKFYLGSCSYPLVSESDWVQVGFQNKKNLDRTFFAGNTHWWSVHATTAFIHPQHPNRAANWRKLFMASAKPLGMVSWTLLISSSKWISKFFIWQLFIHLQSPWSPF